MDTAFLTGATGFVGASLARTLISRGFKVRTLVRKASRRDNLAGLDVELIEGDLGDVSALRAGCRGARYAFHVAADYRIWAPEPASLYASNVDGTVNLIRAARQEGCERIVHCSSVAAIRPPDGRSPVTEDSHYARPEELVSDYKKSKYLGELEAMRLAKEGAPVVVVNPSTPVGPGDIKPTPTGRIIVDFLNGRMPSYVDTGLNLVDVRDVAEGHLLAAQKGRVGERYILGGENVTLKGLLDTLAELTGLPGPAFKTPYAVAYAYGVLDTAFARAFGGEPRAPLDAVRMARHYMWFDSGKARRELGYSPAPARPALKAAVDWFHEHGHARRPVAA